jgi:hypothetical protein
MSNTFVIRYRSGGTPNKPQHQGTCELQGRQIEAPGLLALVLPVNARRWVLADNRRMHAQHGTEQGKLGTDEQAPATVRVG